MSFIKEINAEIRSLKPTGRDLRNLGLVFLVALGVIGGWSWWRGAAWGGWLAGLGLAFGTWGLVWPAGLKPVYRAWMTLAVVMGYFMSRLLLSLIFFLAVTPIGLIMRLMGKDLLDMKMRDRDSYWHRRSDGPDAKYDPRRTEKMY